MRTIIYTLVLLVSVVSVKGQLKEIALKGYLGVEGGESFTYKLVFTDSLGYIKGYSLTWLKEGNEVKALISGTIDRKNNSLSFREEQIAYNKGFSSRTTICLIKATLQYTSADGHLTLAGPISSSDAGNVYCGRGSINITGDDVITQLFAGIPLKDTTAAVKPAPKRPIADKKPIRIIYDTATAAPAVYNVPAKVPDKITSGVEKVFEWNSDTVVVDIWDGGQVDGDVITVQYNEKTVLARYALTKEKKQLILPIADPGIQTITITANNEGNDPPNTANLMLADNAVQHPVIAYNTIGKKAVIRIRKTGN